METRESLIALGLTPPPIGEEVDPETKVTQLPRKTKNVYRRRIKLSEEDLTHVKDVLKKAIRESRENTSLLRSKMERYNNRMEGIRGPKNWPWKNSSNIHIPLTEIHIAIAHSIVTATVLDNDPLWYVRSEGSMISETAAVEPEVEDFLNSKCKKELKLDAAMGEIYWNAFSDPLAIGVMDWVVEYGKEFDVEVFDDVNSFQVRFPDPDSAGVSKATYDSMIKEIIDEGNVQVRVVENVDRYRGPSIRVVRLNNLIWTPVTSPSLEYCKLVGDQFMERDDYFRVRANSDWFDKDEVEKMLKNKGTNETLDRMSQMQDRIEGLGRNKFSSDEYICVRGNVKIDLNDDDAEEMYSFVYNEKTDNLLRFEEYPYWHNRLNYIPFRIRKRTDRLLGRCFNDFLFDINEEVDTQHNQRIDSRTISTVPSFKVKENVLFDVTRKDTTFYPGVKFTVKGPDDITQLDIKQTDMGESQQEEQTLFQLAESLTGVSMLQSGQQTPKDPRAPAKKVQALLAQSNQRVDDYIKELKNPTDEIGSQVLELYYQFSPESIPYAKYDKEKGEWLKKEIKRVKLRKKGMTISIARTSVLDNPSAVQQRAMVRYQMWSKEPLIGQNAQNRHELVRRTLFDLREKEISKLLPPLQENLQALGQQDPTALQNLSETLKQQGGRNSKEPNGKRQGGPDVSPTSHGQGGPQ